MNKNMTYNLGNIKHIPSTGEPLGEDIIAQLENLGTPVSDLGWEITESSNGNSLLHTDLDSRLKNFYESDQIRIGKMDLGLLKEL
jgi:hypothetical protein